MLRYEVESGSRFDGCRLFSHDIVAIAFINDYQASD